MLQQVLLERYRSCWRDNQWTQLSNNITAIIYRYYFSVQIIINIFRSLLLLFEDQTCTWMISYEIFGLLFNVLNSTRIPQRDFKDLELMTKWFYNWFKLWLYSQDSRMNLVNKVMTLSVKTYLEAGFSI